MTIKSKIATAIGRCALLPFSLLKSKTMTQVVYQKGLELVVESGNAYAIDASPGSKPLPEFYRPAEAFRKRFEHVESVIREVGANNLLDIGCAEGYMISRAARETGIFSVGLEMDRNRIRVGNAQSEIANDKNYGIIPAMADSRFLATLPKFDVTICFSVLHHIVRHHGLNESVEFLKSIRKITGKRFLFDMGSPDETESDPEWGNVLSFLKGDIVGKNREFLESAGFVDVKHVGDTPGYIPNTIRPLFVCSVPSG